MEKKPFAPEVGIYTLIAEMLTFFMSVLEAFGWVMSPSRAYLGLFKILTWFRDHHIWHFDQPAFLWVMEQINARAMKLAGTSVDEDLTMEMAAWRDRKPPIPGGWESVLYIFDWFLPILRTIEGKMVTYFGNPNKSAGGKEFTKFEALNTVFGAVDQLYKDPHFGETNEWGQQEAFPWVAFVRNEMYEWREMMKPRAPKPDPNYVPPFSGG